MIIRKTTRISLMLLFLWFSFAVTGMEIGAIKLTVRDFDLPTFVWFLLYVVMVIFFIIKESKAKIAMTCFLSIWIVMQGKNWFASPAGIANYNRIFKDTHHIVPASDKFLIPDTYHLVLISLIVISLINVILLMVKTKKSK